MNRVHIALLSLLLLGAAGVVWAAKAQSPGKPVRVTNFPATLPVTVENQPATQDVRVTNLPATQPVNVQNLPATQDVRVTNFPANEAAPPAPLAPTAPSQLITIRSSRQKCGSSPWLKVDTQVNQDGTLSPFVMSDGMVLVVTSIDWRQGSTGSPDRRALFRRGMQRCTAHA